MYPVVKNEKRFAHDAFGAMSSARFVERQSRNAFVWGCLKGLCCFHYRNHLIQIQTLHLIDFFYPADHSFPALQQDWIPVAAESMKMKKPLPLLPIGEAGRVVQESESLDKLFSLDTSVSSKGVMKINDASTSRGDDALENRSSKIRQTDSKDQQKGVFH